MGWVGSGKHCSESFCLDLDFDRYPAENFFSWEAAGGNMLLILMVNRGYYITYMLYYTDPKAKLNTPLNLYRTTLAKRFAYSVIYSTV